MIRMALHFLSKGDKPPLKLDNVAHVNDGTVTIFCLEGGMRSGAPSVAFALTLPEGGTIVFETSAKLFVATAKAIEARYPGLLA